MDAAKVIKLLPDWALDSMEHPSGLYELRGFIAKHFGVVINAAGELDRAEPIAEVCFKKSKSTDRDALASASVFGANLLRTISYAVKARAGCNQPSWENLDAPKDIRFQVLAKGRPWVGLAELLDVCWLHGIPVVYAQNVPTLGSKMHGMATFQNGRPSILISKKATQDHPGSVLFTVAHEMGHIFHGHVTEASPVIVDEEVSVEQKGDQQEAEANEFALALLTGGQSFRLPKLMNARKLAAAASLKGQSDQIDPAFIILNAINNTRVKGSTPWGLGVAALKLVDDAGGADSLFREKLLANIDFELLSEDTESVLKNLNII